MGPSGCCPASSSPSLRWRRPTAWPRALGFVVLAVGLQSPVVMLLAFVPMMFVAIGYQQLNKVMPDCGTTFTWGAKAFDPVTGWMGGWGIIAADVIVMANLAAIAGSYLFLLFGAQWAGRQQVVGSAGRAALDRGHGLYLLHRHRDQRAHPVRIAGDRTGGARHPQRHGSGQGVRRECRPSGHPSGRGLVQPVPHDPLGVHGRDAHRPVHLLGLGHRRFGQRGDQGPVAHRESRPSCPPSCCSWCTCW